LGEATALMALGAIGLLTIGLERRRRPIGPDTRSRTRH